MTRRSVSTMVTAIAASALFHASVIAQMLAPVPTTPSLSKIGADSWGSGGSGVTERGILAAAVSNPANFDFSSPRAAVEAAYRGRTTYVTDIRYNGLVVAPAFLSIGIPVDQWRVGLSYFNYLTERIKMPDIPVTTADQPDGTGQYLSFQHDVRSHVLVASAQTSVDRLALGVSMGANYVRFEEGMGSVSTSGNGVGLLAVLGGRFDLNEELSFGAAVRYASRVHLVDASPGYPVTVKLDSVRTLNLQTAPRPAVDARFPWNVEAGASWRVSEGVRLFGSLEHQQWSAVNPAFGNPTQVHLGLMVAASEICALRLGYFSQRDPDSGYRSEDFLTGGISLSWGAGSISLSIQDSHLFHHQGMEPILGPNAPEFQETNISSGFSILF